MDPRRESILSPARSCTCNARLFLAVLAAVASLGGSASVMPVAATELPVPPSLAELAIEVTRDHPREFIFTDKGAAHLAGEAVGPDTRSYHGFYIAMHELLDGWSLLLDDGTEVGETSSVAASVVPDRLVRRHRLPQGEELTETVTLLDDANGFRVVYDGVPSGRFSLVPRVDMRFLWRVGRPAYEVEWRDGILRLARRDRIETPDGEHPAWLAIQVTGAAGFEPDGRHLNRTYPKGAARRAMAEASPYLPGGIAGQIPPRIPSGRIEVVFAAGRTSDDAAARARLLRTESFEREEARRKRLQQLVSASHIATGSPRDDRALAWARISLDNLIMNQRGMGIYAGFYWFTTYWGRDSFIVLPGASVVSGDFDTAETILRSFAAFQQVDPASDREGRLPNFVTVEQIQYASIDGTWWFVRALDELWRRSGRDAFAREMAPVVFGAVEGALQYAVDQDGFLTHGDGETWMDAGGEDNPYSPRGDRAVEVQALWHRGLLVAARLAERFGALEGAPAGLSTEELAARYREQADKLARSFHAKFWRDGRLVDHLDRDGDQDLQIRPNGLLAVMASPTLFAPEQRRAVAEAAATLVKPRGVLSLTEDDPDFKPRHLDLGNYYYDAAYHNGDIWLWLSGSYISTLPDAALGFGQTRMLLDEILDEGAAGTLQEIRDGAAAASNDEFGGATSQAWSLSELLRAIVDDYLGLRADLTAEPPRVMLTPSLPEAWPGLTVRTKLGEYDCLIACRKVEELKGILFDGIACTVRFRQEPPAEWLILLGPRGQDPVFDLTPVLKKIDGSDWPFELSGGVFGGIARALDEGSADR